MPVLEEIARDKEAIASQFCTLNLREGSTLFPKQQRSEKSLEYNNGLAFLQSSFSASQSTQA